MLIYLLKQVATKLFITGELAVGDNDLLPNTPPGAPEECKRKCFIAGIHKVYLRCYPTSSYFTLVEVKTGIRV